MQNTEHCTGGRTKLYVLTAFCTVHNTPSERFHDAMAEKVMFEADLWDVDSLSRTNIFRFCHCVNIVVQHDGFMKSIGEALLMVRFLSYLDWRTYQTQAVILGENWTSFHLPSWWAVGHRRTDTLTGESQLKRMELLPEYMSFQSLLLLLLLSCSVHCG